MFVMVVSSAAVMVRSWSAVPVRNRSPAVGALGNRAPSGTACATHEDPSQA